MLANSAISASASVNKMVASYLCTSLHVLEHFPHSLLYPRTAFEWFPYFESSSRHHFRVPSLLPTLLQTYLWHRAHCCALCIRESIVESCLVTHCTVYSIAAYSIAVYTVAARATVRIFGDKKYVKMFTNKS